METFRVIAKSREDGLMWLTLDDPEEAILHLTVYVWDEDRFDSIPVGADVRFIDADASELDCIVECV